MSRHPGGRRPASVESALRTLILCGVVALLLGAGSAARAYSVAGDFSLASNPNGPWSYGYTSSLGGAFNLFTVANAQVSGWYDQWTTASGYPDAGLNTSGITQGCCGSVSAPPDVLALHPDSSGAEAVVRFTAPAAGSYDIQGFFEGLDYAYPTTTDAHILLNSSTSLFATAIGSFQIPASFSLTQDLVAGDTIDFVVGFGADGSYLGDTTGLVATISAVPEPSTLLLLGTGMLGLARASWRRQTTRRA